MGVFSSNRTSLTSFDSNEIVANENYYGEIGALQMLAESHINDLAIFEGVIGVDFQEASLNEAYEVEALLEASASGLFDKVKEFVKKVWEKIKGLFKTFIAKLTILVTRDNKTLVEKYKKEVTGKDLSKMKCKFEKVKASGFTNFETSISGVETLIEMSLKSIVLDVEKEVEAMNDSDYLDTLYSKFVANTTASDFAKDAHELMFEDAEEHENIDIYEHMKVLTDSNKTIKGVKTLETNTNKIFTSVLKSIDAAQKAIQKDLPGSANEKISKAQAISNSKGDVSHAIIGTKKTGSEANKIANGMHTCVSKLQQVATTAVSIYMKETKNAIAQSRKVFGKAVSFNPKSVKESVILGEATGEAFVYEMESFMESYEF